MYLESLCAENVRHLGSGRVDFADAQGAIRKWTVLEPTDNCRVEDGVAPKRESLLPSFRGLAVVPHSG